LLKKSELGILRHEIAHNATGGNSVKINTATQLCAVIGNPVAHSFSPALHNAAFEALKLNYIYVAFRVEDVAGALTGMRALPSFRGMSVTIPHKVAVMPYLDEIDPLAQHVGCVNTITNEQGRLLGSITDGVGTLRAFDEAGVSLEGKRVLFAGAGGAVRAVAFAMAEKARPAGITILGRTRSRVESLVRDLRETSPTPITAGDLATEVPKAMAAHEVVVQGTPLGMFGHETDESSIPVEYLRPEQVVFDMVYRPVKTRLIEAAEMAGCKVVLGMEMLLHQAVLQFESWTGVRAPEEVMRAALRKEVQT